MEDGVVRPSVYLSEVPNGILSRLSNIKEEVRRRERSVLSLSSPPPPPPVEGRADKGCDGP